MFTCILYNLQTFFLIFYNGFYRFKWYVDGKQIQFDNNKTVIFYSPKATRNVAQFLQPVSGQYTVVAQNEYGASKSSGYIEIQTGMLINYLINFSKINQLPRIYICCV